MWRRSDWRGWGRRRFNRGERRRDGRRRDGGRRNGRSWRIRWRQRRGAHRHLQLHDAADLLEARLRLWPSRRRLRSVAQLRNLPRPGDLRRSEPRRLRAGPGEAPGRRRHLRAEDVRHPGLQLRTRGRWLWRAPQLRRLQRPGDLRRRGHQRCLRSSRVHSQDLRPARRRLRRSGRRLRQRHSELR